MRSLVSLGTCQCSPGCVCMLVPLPMCLGLCGKCPELLSLRPRSVTNMSAHSQSTMPCCLQGGNNLDSYEPQMERRLPGAMSAPGCPSGLGGFLGV